MKDLTAIMQVAAGTSGVYDTLGFQGIIALYSTAAAVTVSAGDDSSDLTALSADSPAVVTRYTDDQTACRVSYVGGARYVKFSGTPTAVVVAFPEVAPVGTLEAPETTNGGGGGDTLRVRTKAAAEA